MKSNKLELLKLDFHKTLKQCEGFNDDRTVFINCYNCLVNAITEFESLTINSPIIKVAFSEQFNKERQELKQFEQSLKNRNMIK